MVQDSSISDSHQRRPVLLKDQVGLVKRKDCDRYEIASIQDPLSFEKGFFIVIRACQLLAQKNEGIILVGLAGPSGAGKTVFTEKILSFMPSVAVISMDNYNDSSRVVDGNFDGKSSSYSFFFFYEALAYLWVFFSPEVVIITEIFLH
jgi:uridine kinase